MSKNSVIKTKPVEPKKKLKGFTKVDSRSEEEIRAIVEVAEKGASELFDSEIKPEWDDFDNKTIEHELKTGVIVPELKMRKNATYIAVLTKLPELVKSGKGDFYVAQIRHDNLIKSVKTNRSFLRCLRLYKQGHNVSYKSLVGKEIRFIKNDEGYVSVQFQE